MRDDTNVDWIHGLPFHSFDPSAYGRSVALVAFTYSTPWLALVRRPRDPTVRSGPVAGGGRACARGRGDEVGVWQWC